MPVGGVRELIEDGETGIVARRNDAEDLAERVVELLQTPELRGRLGDPARKRSGRFSAAAAASAYDRALRELTAGTDRTLRPDK